MFDLFMQVDASLERSVSGLGIGLTLVRKLVEMHGGTVDVQSAGVGHGSEFRVRLPLDEATSVAPSAPGASSLPRARAAAEPARHRILVVDDNHDAAESMASLLNMSGHQTLIAYDGIEALTATASFRPDAVLLDIGLPKLNGFEVARRLRAEPWGRHVVLLALTGWGQEEDRSRSAAAGFDGHLVKPVDFDDLANVLDELLSARQP